MQCYCPLLINCSSRISKNRADQLGPICINLLSWIAICVSKTALAQIQTSFDHRLTACPGILLTEGQRLSCRKMLSKDIKRVYTGARQFSYVQSMYWDMAQTMARISCTQVEINMTWQPWQRCFANGVVGDPLSIAWILSDPHWGVGAGMGRVVLMFVVSQVVVIAHKMMLNHDWYHAWKDLGIFLRQDALVRRDVEMRVSETEALTDMPDMQPKCTFPAVAWVPCSPAKHGRFLAMFDNVVIDFTTLFWVAQLGFGNAATLGGGRFSQDKDALLGVLPRWCYVPAQGRCGLGFRPVHFKGSSFWTCLKSCLPWKVQTSTMTDYDSQNPTGIVHTQTFSFLVPSFA